MCGGPEQFRSLVCTLRFLPARQVFFQPAAGRGSTAPAVRPGLGVGNSGGQADDELGARARAIAAGRDAAPNWTKDFTRARPSPSPRALLPVAGPLPERVEHPRQQLGGGPPAVVPHPQDGRSHRHFNAPVLIVSVRHGHGSLVRSSGSCRCGRRAASRPSPPRSAPPCLECSSSLSQTAPPSTSLLPHGSLAPVLSEELSCDVPCCRSS